MGAWRAQFTFTWCQYSRTGSASTLYYYYYYYYYYYCDDNSSDNSNFSGRSGHKELPKISAEYRFKKSLKIGAKAVLLQNCHTLLKFLRHVP